MPPTPDTQTPTPPSRRIKWLLIVLGLSVLFAAAFYFYQRIPQGSDAAQSGTPVTLVPFESKLILSLATTVNDKAGTPFSGVVEFDPKNQTYVQLANTDEGIITNIGETSFAPNGTYLAMRNAASSSDLVIYDKTTLKTTRVVTPVESGSLIGGAFWSRNAEKIAYFLVGTTKAELVVENVDGTDVIFLDSNFPIGFSPDTQKLLVRGTPALLMVDIDTGELIPTTGTAFVDMDSTFELSQSGEYLVAYTEKTIDMYRVNWQTAEITLLDTLTTKATFADVLFTASDTLLVRETESNLMIVYEYKEGEGMVPSKISDVPLATGADILKVLTW